jgi:hypothetical protein
MQSAEKDTDQKQSGDEDGEDVRSAPRSGEEIVCTPAESLGCVVMDEPTYDEPDREDDPRVGMIGLTAPDVERDESGKEDGFEKIHAG